MRYGWRPGWIPSATGVVSPQSGGVIALGADISLDELEREHIARVVANAPTLEAAARTLGIDVRTLQRKRKHYGLG